MTNVFLICAGMLGSDVAKNNGELSILGRPNPSCKLERIVEAHGGYLPFYRRVINGFRYLKTMLLAPGRIPNMIARVDEAAQMLHAASETLAVAEAWNCIDSFMESYRNRADGIATSSTSAAWAAAAMKLLATPTEQAWSPKLVSNLATLLRNDEGDVAESADVIVAIEGIRNLIYDMGLGDCFATMSTEAAAQWLHGDAPLSIRAKFKELLVRHGLVLLLRRRCQDWATNQAPLVELLQNAARYGRHDARKVKRCQERSHSSALCILSPLGVAMGPFQSTQSCKTSRAGEVAPNQSPQFREKGICLNRRPPCKCWYLFGL